MSIKLKNCIFSFLFLGLVLMPVFFISAGQNSLEENLGGQVQGSQEKIEINFFFGKTCPHCAKEKAFLRNLGEQYPEIEIKEFDVAEDSKLLENFYNQYEVSQEIWGLVPVTFVSERYFVGYGGDSPAGKEIENYVLKLLGENNQEPNGNGTEDERKTIKIPIIGEINLAGFSPLALSIVLGILDGFNACAMTALGFLLAVLISTGIRKKVFLIGGVFIFISGVVYFIILSAWLNLFLVLEQIKIITFIVGLVVILFSIILLREYFHGIVCKLCEIDPSKQSIFTKIEKKLFGRMKMLSTAEIPLLPLLLGVSVVAVGINLIELVCSFGFPLAFTKMLTNIGLEPLSYYFYISIYVLFYMIDDFLIFTVAVVALRKTNLSEKYLKAIKLISGIFLLAMGLALIFKPELLSFGV